MIGSPVADEILTRLDAAVEASVNGVKMGAEFTWPILVRQQVIEGLSRLIAPLLGFIFSALAIMGWMRFLHYDEQVEWVSYHSCEGPSTHRSVWHNIAAVLSGAAFLLLFFGIIDFLVTGAITKLLNPEYHALMDVLNALGL